MRPQKWQELSIWYWWRIMHGDFQSLDEMLRCLQNEKQSVCAVIFERGCSGRCRHCIYAECEVAVQTPSQQKKLHDIVCNIVKQLPKSKRNVRGTSPALIHLGREFNSADATVLKACRDMRPDLRINLINKGDFVKHIHAIKELGFSFNQIEISVDGPKHIHNAQRNNSRSFQEAMRGIKNARSILLPNGTLGSLCTLTNINSGHVEELSRILLEENLVDTLTFAPISPDKTGLELLETSQKEFNTIWTQLEKVFARYNTRAKQKVFLQIFRHQDMQKIIHAVGKKKFWEAFNTIPKNRSFNGIIGMHVGKIQIRINGVTFFYAPNSISATEGILVDGHAARAALSQPYTLEELDNDPELEKFTFQKLTGQTNLNLLHKKIVSKFWKYFGQQYLEEEISVFR